MGNQALLEPSALISLLLGLEDEGLPFLKTLTLGNLELEETSQEVPSFRSLRMAPRSSRAF